jgi:hypothetical protein
VGKGAWSSCSRMVLEKRALVGHLAHQRGLPITVDLLK